MNNRVTRICLVSLTIITLLGALLSKTIPARAEPPAIDSIYFTTAELEELRTLRTAPSHSAIWNNIKSWADAHVNDAPIAQRTSTDWWFWTIDGDEARQFLDNMAFMYAMTENTTYADAGVTWLVSIAGWTRWGPSNNDYGWGRSRFVRAVSFAYSVLKDYMSSENRATVENKMAEQINWIVDYMSTRWEIEYTDEEVVATYGNAWGTVAAGVGLGALAIGSGHADYNEWITIATMCTEEILDRSGDDGTYLEAMMYMSDPFSFVIPFSIAYRHAGGSDYFDTYSAFFSNNIYIYIYTTYENEYGGETTPTWLPLGDDEVVQATRGMHPFHPYVNPLDDIAYFLSKEFSNGYAQTYAETYCNPELMTSYIWKAPDVTSLAISNLPTARAFPDYGLVVMRENWNNDSLVVLFKSGVSGCHAPPNQNSFDVWNDGEWVTGKVGYMQGYQSDSRYYNTIVVNDANVKTGDHFTTTGGQIQEPGDYDRPWEVPWGTVGVLEESALDSEYFFYMRGNAVAVYNGKAGMEYPTTLTWNGNEGGTVVIEIEGSGDGPIDDNHIAGTLTKAIRHLVFIEDPGYFVVFDEYEAGESSEFTYCLVGPVLAIDGSEITIDTDKMKSVILEPESFQSVKTTYDVNRGWITHDFDVIRFHPSSNSAAVNFLTAHFPGSTELPTTKVDQNNIMGVIVETEAGLDLVLFSTDNNHVSEYIELGGYYQSADGNPYTFNGTRVLADFNTYQVMKLETATGANRPPVLAAIGNKIVNEGELLQFTISAIDPDGNPLTYSASNLPTGANFNSGNQTFSWATQAGDAGTYNNVQFSVSDTEPLTDSETITITVTAANVAPVLNPIGNKSVSVGQLLQFTISATDANNNPLTYSASNLPAGAIFTPATRTFSWTPSSAGTYSNIVFQVSDGSLTDSETITITVNQVINNPPVAKDDAYSVNKGGTSNVTAPGVLSNDTDAEGDTLTAIKVSDPLHGTLTLNANGSFNYTHDGSETTSDNFTYRANDSTADSNVATVTITVNPIEDWDVNEDGATNVLDMILVGQHWGETGLTGWIREDANEDGTVNVLDMIIIGQHLT